MLIIKDEKRLPEYGFEKNRSNIWVLNFSPDSDNELSMIVNPMNGKDGEIIMTLDITIHHNELRDALNSYGLFNVEYDIPMETICRMMRDGIIKIVNEGKEVA